MTRRSWLDEQLWRFRQRWETNSQYRAAASGVLGLVLIITLCSCTGALAAGFNIALASVGIGGSSGASGAGNQGQINTGTNPLTGYHVFPTATFGPTPTNPPVDTSPIASSNTPVPTATPAPTATDTPTATPCVSNCGGGGGGGGYSVTVSASYAPATWLGGQTGTINVHTSVGNDSVSFLINWPNGATLTLEPYGQTNGAGNLTANIPIPAGVGTGTAQVNIFADGAAAAGSPAKVLYPPCAG